MSEKNKAPLALRIKRLRRLATWLWHTGKNLRRIDGNNPAQRQRAILTLGNGAINAIGIKLNVNSVPDELSQKGTLIAANHISWLDIFALSALYPSSFIAKQEIKNWPVLGKIGVNAGTVFINRNSRKDVAPINAKITEALQQGRNVSFFPEAKTSLGLSTQPFKAALFQAAIEANAPILPVSLRYYDHKGERTTIPSYAGKMNLLKSLWRIVSMPKIYIDVDFGPPIYPADHPEADRYALKDMTEQFINSKVLEDSPEKSTPNEAI